MPLLEKESDKIYFTENYVEEYLKRGLGSLSKKDIDVLVLKLILDIRYNEVEQELDVFALSKELKISIVKLRNLIKEVQLRYNQLNEDVVKKRFVNIFEKNRWRVEKGYVHISIIDPLLREYLLDLIYKENSFADYSFNPEIIKIEINVFAKVISKLANKSVQEIINQIPDNISHLVNVDDVEKPELIIKNIITIDRKTNITIDLGNVIGGFFTSIFGSI